MGGLEPPRPPPLATLLVTLRHLLKFDRPLKNNFVQVKLSRHLQSLRPVETFPKLLMTSNFGRFASLRIASRPV